MYSGECLVPCRVGHLYSSAIVFGCVSECVSRRLILVPHATVTCVAGYCCQICRISLDILVRYPVNNICLHSWHEQRERERERGIREKKTGTHERDKTKKQRQRKRLETERQTHTEIYTNSSHLTPPHLSSHLTNTTQPNAITTQHVHQHDTNTHNNISNQQTKDT